MTRVRMVLVVVIVLLLLVLLAGEGTWYYLYGGNAVAEADLVPDTTVFFATIPNAAKIVTDYQTSQLKTLIESPNTKPLSDSIQHQIGDKYLDLINTFLPNLSGQSFIAITHYDADHPEKTGFIAAMKPKPGLGNFDAFVDKLKAAYPDLLKEGTTGTGNVAGVDYQYLQGPGASDKICVAQLDGWTVTAWGEASLQDWLERYQKKSSTPSLAQNADYQKSLARVGGDSLALVYLNYHAIVDILQNSAMAKQNNPAVNYLVKKLGAASGAAMSMNFKDGEIVDHFSFLLPQQAQADLGVASTPCAYETLNFTGPDTLFYTGYSVDFKKVWQNLQDQAAPGPSGQPMNPMVPLLTQAIQSWAQGAGIDFQHNILDALGSEASLQLDWGEDTPYPEVGFFVKLDKPDDFKPVIKAIIETTRKTYENQAVINEISSEGHNYASLQFVTQPLPISPTITEDGPYFGIFLTEQQAVRSFERLEPLKLTHNADFTRQIGDKRNGSTQIMFLDSPKLLDRTYRKIMPYLSMAAMFNQTLASALKGYDLPQDLTWLAPIGTWSTVISSDNDGLQGYSVSGIGNQGIYYGVAALGTIATAQAMGYGAKLNGGVPFQGQPQGTINSTPGAGVTNSVNPPVGVTTNAAPAAPTPTPTPDSATNVAPVPDSTSPATNSGTAAPMPDSTANPPPTPASASTNSDANPSTPEPSKPQ
ncbi:MAG: DUF3352 domain-containing protein [Methylacidiphilales bacterium]|nr:DUF3352 domain-containing protein [Candidatus Methylacidiphilales bacterium]